jgi:hypothetical protein
MGPLSKRTLVLSCVLAVGMGYYYFALLLPKAHAARAEHGLGGGHAYGCDFYPIWLTSHELLFGGVNPYTTEMTRKSQIGIYGRTIDPKRPGDPLQNFGVFPHPLYTDFLIAPLAILPFSTVQVVGTVLFPLLVAVSVFLWLSALHLRIPPSTLFVIFLLTFASYPTLEGIYALQLSLIVAALLAGSAATLAKGHLAWAGALLGAASVKPQLVLLTGLWLAVWAASDLGSRKKFLLSLAGTVTLLFVVGEAVLPGWSSSWIHALLEYRQYNLPPLSQFAFGNIAGTLLSGALIVIAGVFAFRNRHEKANSPAFTITFAFLLTVTVPTIPSSIAVYDQILLIPAILWLISHKGKVVNGSVPLRTLGFAAAAVLCWQWVAAFALTLGSFAFPEIRGTRLVMLPLRMAASFPFAVVALWLFLMWKGKLAQDATPAKSAVLSG